MNRMFRFGCMVLVLVAALAPASAEEDVLPQDGKIAELEVKRDRSPRDRDIRDELGYAYYLRARRALDDERFEDYERDLGRALDEWVEELRLDPESARAHTWMGMVAAYQGDLDRGLRSFANARKLQPQSWVNYTNIAEMMTYRGKPDSARKFLRRAEQLRADPTIVEMNLCLIEWRQGRVDEATYHFEEAHHLSPETVNTWNAAPVDEPIRTFDDLAAYCCGDPACGPYMGDACKERNLDVATRELPEAVARKELLLEMERRRKLSEIYATRRDLGIDVETKEEAEQRRRLEIEVEEEAPAVE